jgi:hypothetical protein
MVVGDSARVCRFHVGSEFESKFPRLSPPSPQLVQLIIGQPTAGFKYLTMGVQYAHRTV